MRAFVGCLLFLGALEQNMLPTTVVFAACYGQELVRAAFSRNRFLQLLSYIRFDDKATRNARRRDDVFAPFREFWDKFTQNLKQYYIPGPFITVDEQLVPFQGRCSFLQYLPSKPDRYGLKIFWAAEAETNYPLIAEPYLGKPLGAHRQENLGRNVAIRLSSAFYKTGRNITADNFFTDMVLYVALRLSSAFYKTGRNITADNFFTDMVLYVALRLSSAFYKTGRNITADNFFTDMVLYVALRLSSAFYKTGRNITADNFFTDMVLSDTLLENGLTFVGTVRNNKRFLPDQFKQKSGTGSAQFVFRIQAACTPLLPITPSLTCPYLFKCITGILLLSHIAYIHVSVCVKKERKREHPFAHVM